MTGLQEAIEDYQAIRLANATGLTAAQVKTLNRLEREATEPIEISRDHGLVWVTFTDSDDWKWFCVLVNNDGSLDYKAGA